jgi:excisionase family DNA binding protein
MTTTEPTADSVNAAAVRLGISRSSLYREIAEGHIRAVRARGRTLVMRVDQAAWQANLPTFAAVHAA